MQSNPKLFWFLFLSMFLPTAVGISAGPLRLSLYRIALLIFLVTSVKYVLTACKVSLKNPNFLMLAYGCWAGLALVVNHSLGAMIETAGIYVVETIGPFLIVLAYCTTIKRLKLIVNTYITIVCLTLVITIPENLTNFNVLKEILNPIFPSGRASIEKRMGLYRASGPFDHPILQGVVASTAVGLAWFYTKIPRFVLTVIAACTSVSSGAIVAVYIQFMLIGWEKITKFISLKNRWAVMVGLFVTFYTVVGLVSNRSAMGAILGNITMSPHTAYWRMTIWDYGIRNANANPIFGLGLKDWERPIWMYSGSMDAFWLVSMVRYGYVGFLLYAGAVLVVMHRLFKLKVYRKDLIALRRGWLVGMAGLIISSCTVHLWNNAYVFFNFYVGLGAAMYYVLLREKRKDEELMKVKKSESEPSAK